MKRRRSNKHNPIHSRKIGEGQEIGKLDRNEGNTQPQKDPSSTGMDYFEEGEGNPEREKENGQNSPPPSKREKAA